MNLFRLTATTIVTRKTFAIFAVLFLVLPIFMPFLTPWEEKPMLFEPARAQAAWGFLWVTSIVWLLFQGASFGDRWASHGVLEYLKTLGTSRFSQLLQMWLSCMVFFVSFIALVLAVCFIAAMPEDSYEAKMWVATNFQYATLIFLVFAPLVLLSIALGTRINATAAYVITAGVALYGIFGVTYLDFFLSQSGSAILDLVYLISPHYHVADITSRLVFKLGALEGGAFGSICLYLTGLGLVISALSCLIFTEKK